MINYAKKLRRRSFLRNLRRNRDSVIDLSDHILNSTLGGVDLDHVVDFFAKQGFGDG